MNRSTASLGETIAAGCGLLLLLVMFLLNWYSAEVVPIVTDPTATIGPTATYYVTAFQAFTFIDVILSACALLMIVVPLLSVLGAAAGVGGARVVLFAAILAVALILFRLLVPPGQAGQVRDFEVTIKPELGVVIGLVVALAAVVAGFLAVRAESADSKALARAASSL
jgi:hypothetical protein